jgi:hypothetical protein
MNIHTIANATGDQLTLFDVGNELAVLPPGGSIRQIPPVITSVSVGNVNYPNRARFFQDGDSYSATIMTGGGGVLFTGNSGTVQFT